MRKAFFGDNITCDVFARRILISPVIICISHGCLKNDKMEHTEGEARNLDLAALVFHTVDIYLLKKQTANVQSLNLRVTLDGERTAKRQNSLLNWAKSNAQCRYHWKTGRAQPLAADHEDDAQALLTPTAQITVCQSSQ